MKYLISIDLETYSNMPEIAAIASIGMAAYRWDNGEQVDEYFAIIRNDSALAFGQSDEDTMNWWKKQPEHAQRVLHSGNTTIPDALTALHDKIRPFNDKAAGTRADIVARAPSFDCAILRRHFEAAKINCPWRYWQERDHRTYEEAWLSVLPTGQAFPSYIDYAPVAHDALLDAKKQAEYLLALRHAVRS